MLIPVLNREGGGFFIIGAVNVPDAEGAAFLLHADMAADAVFGFRIPALACLVML